MARARRIDEATVRTQQGFEVTLLAMDDGSLAVLAPPGATAWSVVSLFSGPSGTRLRLRPRHVEGEDKDDSETEVSAG